MENITVLLLVAIIFGISQIIMIVINLRIIKKYRQIRYRDMTQRDFGIARFSLFKLVESKQLNVDSATFCFFYHVDTKIMRRPDKFSELTHILRTAFTSAKDKSDAKESPDTEKGDIGESFINESESWTPEIREMVYLQIKAFTSLIVFHSPILRLSYAVAKLSLPIIKTVVSHELGWMQVSNRIATSHNDELKVIVETKNELKHLVRA